ncbi:PQQ-dependent sugar dehydrogenase [Sphingobacterium sp.]|uniref:PQQ-dependent sugar dehydrogenase n=1 Tax=Sphingobacterium sp. TaxID=341027 RepID=UPI0028A2A810|nr:PQQ-dependent sugar dehydrogenase [Sphingobacterium sp.]
MEKLKPKFKIALSLFVLLTGCGRDNDNAFAQEPNGTDPVETNPPNSNYRPAFPEQTRANGVQTTTSYSKNIITSSLTSPWGIVSLPDGRLLITEKVGQMRIVTRSGEIGDALTGIPQVNASGQGGLLGLCLDPEFSSNRLIFWVFSEAVSGGNVTSVAKGKLSDNDRAIENPAVIFRAGPAHSSSSHYGGRIVFDRTGHLVVSTGERSSLLTRPLAQSVGTGLGKVVRLTKDGQPAPDNPSFTESGAIPELYTYGHRNPQGLAIHPLTGRIWLSEMGPRGGDEINLLKAGANYGWPVITYGIEYSGQPIGAAIQQQEGMEQPVYYWDPVVSTSGMVFYNSDRIPEWQNNLFVGALSGQHIVRLVIENDRVVGEERLLTGERQRFRDITQGQDGALYAVTDQGRLYRIDRE